MAEGSGTTRALSHSGCDRALPINHRKGACRRARSRSAEWCIEIISEASRRIPNEWKAEHPSIPWADIAGIGSVLRHNYEDVNLDLIVKLRGTPLENLKTAVVALLDKYDPAGRTFRER